MFHEDRLIAALNKYYRALNEYEYLNKWDLPTTQNAVAISGFPEEVKDWIWETKREAFAIY